MAATTVVMPKMGYDMTRGRIVRWLKHEGEHVEKGQPIAEIETEKVNIEIEAFATGTILKVLVPEGQEVPVGQPIALIGEPGEEPAEAPPAQVLPTQQEGAGEGAEAPPATVVGKGPAELEAPPTVVGKGPAELERPPVETPGEEPGERVKASPMARRLAEEQGVELSQVPGTGPGGRITKDDVERFLTEAARRKGAEKTTPAAPKAAERASPPPPAPAAPPEAAPATPAPEGVPVETRELSRMGQAIARRMAESKRSIPHFYATMEIDMSRVAILREELNRTRGEGEKISFNDFVMKAAAVALTRFPNLNAYYSDAKLNLYQEINLAMAVALEEGLITPVIRNCDRKTLAQIAKELKDLAGRAREGKLRQEEYGAGTFTVTNLGMFGVEEFAAIINPPQAAILAVGAVAPRPVVRDGLLDVATTMKATISVDHRATNGAEAARYLAELRQLLEEPGRLLA